MQEPLSADKATGQQPLTLLIDGDCPLCKREVAWLARRDKAGRLKFVDIAAQDFDPQPYARTIPQLMGAIHAVQPDGRMITGVEVFRQAYTAIGLGWLIAPTRWPMVRQLADFAYLVFAKLRPMLQRSGRDCNTGRCKV